MDIYTGNDKIRVINFYLPPEAQASPQQIKSLLDATTIVVGDANAHHPLWDKKGKPDQRGEEMIELLEDGNLVLLNEPNTHTRLPYDKTNSPTSPDISATTEDIALQASWVTLDKKMSDHLPIIMGIETEQIPEGGKESKKRNINLRKADWSAFQKELECIISKISPAKTVEKLERQLRDAVSTASKHTIPQGRHKENTPKLPPEARKLIACRDKDTDPQMIALKNKEIQRIIAEDRRGKWMEFVEENKSLSTGKLWKAIKSICGKTNRPSNNAITFNGQEVSKDYKIANKLNRHFANSCETKMSKDTRRVKREAAKIKLSEATFTIS